MKRTDFPMTIGAALVPAAAWILMTAPVQTTASSTQASDTIRIPVPRATPTPQAAVVPSDTFTGVVRRVMDARTLEIAREAPAPAAAPKGPYAADWVVSTIKLWGVAAPPDGSEADRAARKLLEQTVGKRVAVTLRHGTVERPGAPVSALVYALPETHTAVDFILPARRRDATGTSSDTSKSPVVQPPQVAPPAAAPVGADDCVNYALVKQGFGRWDRVVAPDSKEFAAAEGEAQKTKRGIWSGG